ncbi:hypothetical protein DNTS_014221, partial [Danionella cerebrum]
ECNLSLCALYGMVQCDCPGESKIEKCHMCCQQKGSRSVCLLYSIPNTCASTTSVVLSHYFNGTRVSFVPGTPCSGNQGYCDRFKICRILDADGPIARLKNSFLKLDEFDDLGDWMKRQPQSVVVLIVSLEIAAKMKVDFDAIGYEG